MVATGQFEAWAEIVDPDFVLRFPFAPPGVPEELRGLMARDALVSSATSQERFEWKDVAMTATEDPELLVTTARSEVLLKSGGTYANRYVMMTRIRGGKIVEQVEYFNPLPILEMIRQ
jgi:hypothetical protein